ncbi:MAG TPA: hypothetical protein VFI84_00800 [Candidatus Saccharimonadales bacterium]|nr:hypothetical protein [Candidatus Saccharimonadales bacterium]
MGKIEKALHVLATGGISLVTKEKVDPIEVDYPIPGSEHDTRHYAEDSLINVAEVLRAKHGINEPYKYLAEIATGLMTFFDKGQED